MFNPYLPNGVIEKLANFLNRKQRWYDRFFIDLNEDWVHGVDQTDDNVFIETAKRLSKGEAVSRCNLNNFLRIACEHYLERAHPESIDNLSMRVQSRKILNAIREG